MNDRSLNVLFITRKWPPSVGGMETYSVELSTELDDIVNLEILCLHSQNPEKAPSLIRVIQFLLQCLIVLVRDRNRYDILHLGDMVLFPLSCWNRIWSATTKNVLSLHGLDCIYHRRSGFLPGLYGKLMNWAAKSTAVDMYIANSRATQTALHESGIGPSCVIPLGTKRPDVRNNQRPDDDQKYVAYFGRIMSRKGPGWFAEQVAPLLPNGISFKVMGTVWEEDELEKIDNSENSKFLGLLPKEKEQEICRNAIAVVMPNKFNTEGKDIEGFGLVAVETAALGVPILAANTEGLRDAVVDGKTGFLIEPDRPLHWVEKITELSCWTPAKRASFVRDSLQIIGNYYSWKRVAEEVNQVYCNVLSSTVETTTTQLLKEHPYSRSI